MIATGVQYSVRDFVNAAASELGHGRYAVEGQGIEEKGYDAAGNCIVSVDPLLLPPDRSGNPAGRCVQAKSKLGWEPATTFKELVVEMVREDLRSAERDQLIKRHGYSATQNHE